MAISYFPISLSPSFHLPKDSLTNTGILRYRMLSLSSGSTLCTFLLENLCFHIFQWYVRQSFEILAVLVLINLAYC